MKLLDRYIARQIVVSSIYAIAVIIIILVLGNVFKEILKELAKRPDLSLGFVFQFILLVIPISLSLAVPFSFLTAILLTFGRLSADSEFVAMRMAGLSMWRICVPVGVIAIGFSCLCAFVNLSVTPWAKVQMQGMKASLFNQMKREPLMIFPDQQVMTDLPDHIVYAKKEDGMLKGLQIIKMVNAIPQAIVVAREARVTVDFESEVPEMLLDMTDVNIVAKGNEGNLMNSARPVFMESAPFGVSVEIFKQRSDKEFLKPSHLSLTELYKFAYGEVMPREERMKYRIELSTRFAYSVSCLTFGLIGVPLGLNAQRRESSAGFVLSMIIAVSNYAMLNAVSMIESREDLYPHYVVWVPNLLFFGLGLYLFIKLSRK